MGIRIGDFHLVYESVCHEPIKVECLTVTEESFEQYIAEHPPPPGDDEYGMDELRHDLLNSSGFWSVPSAISCEWEDYICDLVRHFL